MSSKHPEMIDMVFDLDGGTIPASYPFALWAALIKLIPQLSDEKSVGVLPLRATENKEGVLLPKRAKLTLRLPVTLIDKAAALTGKQLDLAGSIVTLGEAKTRPIRPSPTIHAQQVAGASDELRFIDEVKVQLKDMGIAAKLICGKRRTIGGGEQSITCYSLVLHDLKPDTSLALQYAGLGEHRRFGCGIFIPYKVISGLGDD